MNSSNLPTVFLLPPPHNHHAQCAHAQLARAQFANAYASMLMRLTFECAFDYEKDRAFCSL